MGVLACAKEVYLVPSLQGVANLSGAAAPGQVARRGCRHGNDSQRNAGLFYRSHLLVFEALGSAHGTRAIQAAPGVGNGPLRGRLLGRGNPVLLWLD